MLRVPNSATSLRFPLVFVVPKLGAPKMNFLQKCCSNYEFWEVEGDGNQLQTLCLLKLQNCGDCSALPINIPLMTSLEFLGVMYKSPILGEKARFFGRKFIGFLVASNFKTIQDIPSVVICKIMGKLLNFNASSTCSMLMQLEKSNKFFPTFSPYPWLNQPSRPQFWPWHRWRCLSFRHARMDGLFCAFSENGQIEKSNSCIHTTQGRRWPVTFLCLKCGIVDIHVFLNSWWPFKAHQKQDETTNISVPPPSNPPLGQIWPPWPDHLFWWGQPGGHSTLICLLRERWCCEM